MTQPADALTDDADNPTLIHRVRTDDLETWRDGLDDEDRAWLERQQFAAKPGETAWLKHPAPHVVIGWDGESNLATYGHLPYALPEGEYALADDADDLQLLGWLLGAYRFDRYKDMDRSPARLATTSGPDIDRALVAAESVYLARDLINTPAEDMRPSHMAAEVEAMAERFGAQCAITLGDALLDIECGAIHAVGRAADDPPCLIDLSWGDASHPLITVVGKGVTFDSGGLDIKPASGMRTMKKDMGGAAAAIALAYRIMAAELPVRLRLLVPAAENAISGNAFRPGDILSTHKGITVEIDNTDAEGRLLLCDALSIASDEQPEFLVDFATLTGSARSAVGAEIGAMFANDDDTANAIYQSGVAQDDAVWRMPLHAPYRHMLDSTVADTVNSAASPYAGSITAALYLEKFVDCENWVHFDIMAFNIRRRAGRPEGGEAMAARAVFGYLEAKYG